jgi:hypothetical protein
MCPVKRLWLMEGKEQISNYSASLKEKKSTCLQITNVCQYLAMNNQ